MNFDSQTWNDYAEALAFAGNSLLSPMSQTGDVALDPAFWDAFPDFGDPAIAKAVADCRAYAEDAQRFMAQGGNAVQRASVEYTKLFIGPPRPAAAPWETMYRVEGNTVGFGEATYQMQRLLREAGLKVSNENNQYADHIGIELLYASTLCGQIACAGEDAVSAADGLRGQLAAFAAQHPLSWMGKLVSACEAEAPGGFVSGILRLAKALLDPLAPSAIM